MLIIENPSNLGFSHNKNTCGETLLINLKVNKNTSYLYESTKETIAIEGRPAMFSISVF